VEVLDALGMIVLSLPPVELPQLFRIPLPQVGRPGQRFKLPAYRLRQLGFASLSALPLAAITSRAPGVAASRPRENVGWRTRRA
jgi:hypothetical protein